MRALPSILALAALGQLGATDCGGGVLRDPGFDLWCGDALCAWKLERGAVARAPTWHAGDLGVALDDGAAIEQFSPVNSGDGTCLSFELVADVDAAAQVELAIDVYGDGSVERTFPVPAAHWQSLAFVFAVRAPYTGIRFELAKRGTGRAVVGRLHAAVADACAGLPAIDGGPAPLGARCAADADCASRLCRTPGVLSPSVCVGCDAIAAPCPAGQACGLAAPGPPEREVPIECVAAGARATAERCVTDAECATGICADHVCSACRSDADCAGAACRATGFLFAPQRCGAGEARGRPGAPCALDDDCASGACAGPSRHACLDGRACASEASCPVDGALHPGACMTMGVLGGRCR
jgi:hypothetical protein